MGKKWKCSLCGYLHEGLKPPDACPVCGAFKWQFILYEELPPVLEKRLREAVGEVLKKYPPKVKK